MGETATGAAIAAGISAGSAIRVPDTVFPPTAAFARHGADLLLSDAAGNTALIRGYFAGGGTPPDLVTSGGAMVHGGTALILAGSPAFVQVAQAGGAPAGPAPIGKVRVADGTVRIVHNGVEQDAAPGSDIYRNDVLVTGPNSAVGVRFADGTQFSLGSNGRMTMDQFAYNPQGGIGQMLLSVLSGTFSFVSGGIAKTGDDAMRVQMPAMTMGIRGTTAAGQAAAEGSENSATLLRNTDGTIGAIFAFNSQSGYLIAQANFTAFANSQFAPLSQPALLVDLGRYQEALTALQTLQRSAADSGTDTAELNQSPADQALARLLAEAQPGAGDGSGEPGGLNYSLVTFADLGITLVVFQSGGRTYAALFNNEPAPPPGGGDLNGTDGEEANNRRQQADGSNASPSVTTTTIAAGEDGPATGHIAASDPDSDPLTFALVKAPLLGTVTLAADGSYVYTPGTVLQGLKAGATASDSFTIEVSDGRGGVTEKIIAVEITGANDAPTLLTDSNAAVNSALEVQSTGTTVGIVAKAFDIDGDTLTYTLVDNAGGRFAIDPATGVVTVANGALVDHETTAGYTITVQASDGTASTTASFTITVRDSVADGLFNPSSLDGVNGFRLDGAAANDTFGRSVASAGDVNGDGYDDLIVGASTDVHGINSGSAYIVFGKASGFTTPIQVSALDGSAGFRIDGAASLDNLSTVGAAGDVNGDGFADLIVGAPYATGFGPGAAYVVFGKASGFASAIEVSSLNGTTGFKLSTAGNIFDSTGYSVTTAGDVNGDGYDDVIVGAAGADPGFTGAGTAYVVFGRPDSNGASGFSSTIELSALNGTTGFRLNGVATYDFLGVSVTTAGDVNGDGFADLVVGASGSDTGAYGAGSTYVLFGKSSGFGSVISVDTCTLNGVNGFRLDGAGASDQSGKSVSTGDVNGDGFDDLIIGAGYADPQGSTSGSAYVVFGKASGFASSISLSTLDGTTGFRLDGSVANETIGRVVSSAGDVNGDGYDDLLIGTRYTGHAFVVYGKAGGFGSAIDLSTLDGSNGFRVDGVATNDHLGRAVSAAGDVNGDGFDDLIIGARFADPNGYNSGSSYVLFGGNFTSSVTFLGDATGNSFTGTSAAERFVGGQGDDVLTGQGGADVFEGGAGNDVITASGTTAPLRVDGGSGVDTFKADGLADALLTKPGFLHSIEKIDLTGGAANTLVLDKQTVVAITGQNGDAFPDNTLLIKGDVGDTIDLKDAWTVGANVTNPQGETGTYRILTNGAATLLVEADITLTDTTTDGVASLANLFGSNGFRLDGVAAHFLTGRSVASAGDVNGDGFDDLIIGAYFANSVTGYSYVVFGGAGGFAPSLDLSSLDGTTGFRLDGTATGDSSGRSVASAGDVNGDGFGDVIVGASGADANGLNSGSAYVLYGRASGFASSIDLSAIGGTIGFRLDGTTGDGAGSSVASAGDVNGDGLADLVIGATTAPSNTNAGRSFVVFGRTAGFASVIDLNALDGTTGFRLDGAAAQDRSGRSSVSAGDVNGDGFDDLIIGAYGTNLNGASSGSAYVVFGKASGFAPAINLSGLNGTTGFRLDGAAAGDLLGLSVASAGDVNGDGFGDLIVGARGVDTNGSDRGSAYVVFGQASGFAPTIDLSSLDGTTGFRLDGVANGDFAGEAVSSAGDVNGDGYDDLIVGAPMADPQGIASGTTYVIFGHASPFAPLIDLSALDGATGFRLEGEAISHLSGSAVSSAGDVNGDGFDDLFIGARGASPNGNQSGSGYVLFGGDFTASVTHLGGSGNDSFTGGTGAERFVGGAGDDTLTGNGGADAFEGGAGNDVIVASGATAPLRVDGGSGIDTFNADGLADAVIDLPKFLHRVEKIDLSGGHANTLVLDKLTVNGITAPNGDAFWDNALLVKGDAGDVLRLDGGWSFVSIVDDPAGETGEYLAFADGDVTVLAAANLTVAVRDDDPDANAAGEGWVAGIDTGVTAFARFGDNAVTYALTDNAGGRFQIDAATGAVTVANGALIDFDLDGSYTITVEATDGSASSSASFTIAALDTPSDGRFALANLDGGNGVALNGAAQDDRAGYSVSSAGDVNGDGYDDLIVGAPRDSGAGSAYVVFGDALGLTLLAGLGVLAGGSGDAAAFELSALDGENGFRLDGAGSDDTGRSVAGAGDVNGDGFADLIVAAPGPYGTGGDAYVLFGKESGFASAIDLSGVDGTTGFRLTGLSSDGQGRQSVSAAGDINGDGYDDLIVADSVADPHGADSGSSYVVFGKASGFASAIDVSTLDGTNGFRLDGAASDDRSGFAVSAAGDVNGDGFADLLVGARNADTGGANSGSSYIVFGKASAFAPAVDLTSLNGATGFRVDGADSENAGVSVASAGDVNGDGFADLVVGARGGGNGPGRHNPYSYVVFGKRSGFASAIALSALDGSDGFRLVGTDDEDSGFSVSAAGDVNGDGLDDLIVGGTLFGGTPGAHAGNVYVVYGKTTGFASALDLSALDGTDGFRIDGLGTYIAPGWSVSSAGDTNGDGFDDLVVGAPSADPNGLYSGTAYVLLGGNFTASVTHLGTPQNDTLTGTAAADRFVGGRGADRLVGNGGADAFEGGAGNDTILVTVFDSPTFTWVTPLRVDGGSGVDTADLSGVQTGVFSFQPTYLENIEKIDLRGGGVQHLLLTRQLVAAITGENGDDFPDNTLLVKRDAEDDASLAGTLVDGVPVFWTFAGAVADPAGTGETGTYLRFTNGAVTVLVDAAQDGDLVDANLGTNIVVETPSVAGGTVGITALAPLATGPVSYALADSAGGRFAIDASTGVVTVANPALIDFESSGGAYTITVTADVGGPALLTSEFTIDVFNVAPSAPVDADPAENRVFEGIADGATVGLTVLSTDRGGTAVTYSLADDAGGRFAIDPVTGVVTVVDGALIDSQTAGAYYSITVRASDGTDASTRSFAIDLGGSIEDGSYIVHQLDGTTGFAINGIAQFDQIGQAVASAGDVNGDGFDDLVVGAWLDDANGQFSGSAYVVFGKAGGFGPAIDLSALDGTNGFMLQGAAGDFLGRSVSAAGDVNGDGFADVIVGAHGADPNGSYSGASYVVFGKAGGFSSLVALSTLDGTSGFRLVGADGSGPFFDSGDQVGLSVSGAGDVNGDGIDDLLVGAPGADMGFYTNPGKTYVVFGHTGAFSSSITLDTLAGSVGFAIGGSPGIDSVGQEAADAGDVNGDGFADVIVRSQHRSFAPTGVSYTQQVHVVFGSAEPVAATLSVSALDGANGFTLLQSASQTSQPLTVSGAGDVNGDGFADLIVGQIDGAGGGFSRGQSYVVFGHAGAFASSIALTSLDGTNGFRLDGVADGDQSGNAVSAAGDVNGDGYDDLIVAAARADGGGYERGEVYVVYGRAGGFGPVFDLSGLDGSNGFRLIGSHNNDFLGESVASAGDVNGDGFDDLIVGAPSADPNGANSGQAYVVFGGDFTASVTFLGVAGNDGFTGGAGAERFVGGLGDDTLVGGGGADVFEGGAGNDVIVASGSPLRLDGGAGIDVARIDGVDNAALDLPRFLQRVEKIDLGGGINANTLTLDLASVQAIMGLNADAFADNTLLIKGDAGDVVALKGAWSSSGTTTGPLGETGVYRTLTHGALTVLVELDVDVAPLLSDANAAGNAIGDLAPNGAIVGITALGIDPDGGTTITYSLGDDAGGRFAIDANTGVVTVANGALLDFADAASHQITVVASNGILSASADFTIEVVDSAVGPVQDSNATVNGVVESAANGTEVGVTAFAADAPGVPVTYSLSDDAGGRFAIDAVTGVVTVADGSLLDRDVAASHQITIEATDGESTTSATFTIAVADGPADGTVALAGLTGANGLTLTWPGKAAGFSVSDLGDFNGDGFDDLLVGAPFDNAGGGDRGMTFVVFGRAGGFGPTLALDSLDGATTGFRILGPTDDAYAGFSVSGAGDINGDGFADIVIGASQANYGVYTTNNFGESYVVFGTDAPMAPGVAVSTLIGSGQAFRIGPSGRNSGFSVSGAGDVNGDGFDDLILGMPDFRSYGGIGRAYVVFGKAGGFASSLDPASLDGTTGFALSGVTNGNNAGGAVSHAGDVNGDGYDDLIVGADGAGAAYVVFGHAGAFAASIGLGTLDGTTGFALTGLEADGGFARFLAFDGDDLGRFVESAGDVNGDGIDDLIVGALRADAGGTDRGEAYVVFGHTGAFGASLALTSLTGTNGFKLEGVADFDQAGFSVAGAGDVNGDGYDDLIIGAKLADAGGADRGVAYVVYGQAGGFASAIDLSALDGTNGFRLDGVFDSEFTGHSVSAAGDINGDGFDDLVIGAPGAFHTTGGHAYIVFGGSFTSSVTHLGNSGGNTLTGTAAAERFVAGAGDDTLTGGGGADLFEGGAGNDTITASGATAPVRVDGGGGVDTFKADGLQNALLDRPGYLHSIEKIDLAGGSANALVLDKLTVIAITGQNGDAFADNTLLVKGDTVDRVTFADSWTAGAVVDNPFGETGSFIAFTSGAMTALLQVTIAPGSIRDSDAAADAVIEHAASGTQVGVDVLALLPGTAPVVYSLDDSAGGRFAIDASSGVVTVLDGALVDYESSGGSYTITARATAGADFITKSFTITVADVFADGIYRLNGLDGANGFVLNGASANDAAGVAVSGIGDINGDGYDDVAVTAPSADGGGTSGGEVYVVFGRNGSNGAGGFASAIELSALDGTTGFRLNGPNSFQVGNAVSGGGDINGDGYADLVIGARNDPGQGGSAYVVLGHGGSFAAAVDLAGLNGTDGFKLTGAAVGDNAGISVSSAGDVNGDGYDDVIVGAFGADPNGAYSGSSYVVFGKAGGFAGTIGLGSLDGTSGFTLNGVAASDASGWSVSGGGDVNGDGLADLVVGAPNAGGTGGAYVVSGRTDWSGTPSFALSSLDGSNGFAIAGVAANDSAGLAVSDAGDVNGDGFADVIVGAWFADAGGINRGQSYVVFGHGGAFTATVSLAALTGTDGFRLDGIADEDRSGLRISAAGDVNGDGYDDLVVGAPYADPNGFLSGQTYVVYGHAGAFTSAFALSALDGSNGFRLNGAFSPDASGNAVGAAGDVNGDGFDDLVIGATNSQVHGPYTGQAYVLFGGDFTASVTHLGDSGANTLTGTAAAERFVGGAGDDTLAGNGGADVFEGGAGNDVLTASGAAAPLRADGGAGIDTFKADGLIDAVLTRPEFLHSIEKIDLSGSNANTLTLDKLTVLAMTGQNADAFGDNTLLVKGDAGDTVVFSDHWTFAGTVNDPAGETGAYRSFVNGALTVLVETDVAPVDSTGDGIVDLENLFGFNGFRLDGVATGDRSGHSVSAAGDVNGDGFADLIIGAHRADPDAYNGGASYVVFGKASGFASAIDLSSLDGTTGFRLDGASVFDAAGYSVSAAGDVNGDGFADLLVGAYGPDLHGVDSGAAYVVFGKASGFASSIDLSSLDGSTGFRLAGVAADDRSGVSVASAGDVNGDGVGDLIVGADRGGPAGYDPGASYVVFGKASGFAPSIDLSALDGTTGFRLDGDGNFDRSGHSVSAAGDVNGDGFDDLIIGAFHAGPNGGYSGSTYVVFGKASGFASSIDLSSLDGTTGFRLDGVVAIDLSGGSVSAAGDVNGDGFDDLIVGADGADPNGNYESGSSYVLFGGDFTSAVTHLGDSGADTLTGTAADDRFVGDRGDDTLIGNGGADVFEGGAGNDLIQVADLTFQRVDGGGNDDRLLFEAAVGATIDLGDLHGKVEGIETLDFANGIANTIEIAASDVLDLDVQNDDVNGVAAIDNAVTILGDATDTVNLMGAWTGQGADSGGTGFELYTYDAAPDVQVVVDQNMTVNP